MVVQLMGNPGGVAHARVPCAYHIKDAEVVTLAESGHIF